MTLGTLNRWAVLLGAFAVTASLAAQTPSPALVITIRGAGEHAVAIVDPRTNMVVGRVPIVGGGYPHEIAISDDGKTAYVTNSGIGVINKTVNPEGIPGDFISVIDLASQKETRRIELGLDSWPHGIVFNGGKVYYTAEGFQLVGRYDPASNHLDWALGSGQHGQHMIAITKDGNKIFTVNYGSNTVAALVHNLVASHEGRQSSGPTRELWDVTEIPVLNLSEGITVSPDDKELWVSTKADRKSESSSGGITIIDIPSLKVSDTLDLKTPNPGRIKFTPDGKRVVIADLENGNVLLVDAATRKEIKRMKVGSRTHGLVITPDGSRAYTTVVMDNNVAVIDLATFEVTGRITAGTQPESVAWAEAK
jgi:YVTN family beta-propeller protein